MTWLKLRQGAARALLYIVRTSPTFFIHQSYNLFYHTFYHRVLIVGDMNAYSPIWNPHYRQNINVGPLEELIESYELIVNNDTDFPTRSSSLGISIIDLASPD